MMMKAARYLDAYNNVAHVGHGHPHVVNAIANQARRLNTSTRYMHGYILELAEQITKRMPEPLSVCMFVCTGSEANELAWQMSKSGIRQQWRSDNQILVSRQHCCHRTVQH